MYEKIIYYFALNILQNTVGLLGGDLRVLYLKQAFTVIKNGQKWIFIKNKKYHENIDKSW